MYFFTISHLIGVCHYFKRAAAGGAPDLLFIIFYLLFAYLSSFSFSFTARICSITLAFVGPP